MKGRGKPDEVMDRWRKGTREEWDEIAEITGKKKQQQKKTDNEVKHGNSHEPCSLIVSVSHGKKKSGIVASFWQTAKEIKLQK